MGRFGRIGVVCLGLLIASCIGSQPEPQSGVALTVDLPGPIVPGHLAKALYPTQDTEVTIETEGSVWIEVRSSTRVIASELFEEKAQVAELIDLEPGSGYTLGVFAGIFSEDPDDNTQINGKIRFASVQKINIPPDETVEAVADMVLCDTILDDLDKLKADVCDPDFGVEIAPPKAPEIFPIPSKTGCLAEDRNSTLVIAGKKPLGTLLIDNNNNVAISVTDVAWYLNPFEIVFGDTEWTRSYSAAHDFDLQIESPDVQARYQIDDEFICFDPYDLDDNADIKKDGSDLKVSWNAGDKPESTVMQPLLVEVGTSLPEILSHGDLQQAIADSEYDSPDTNMVAPPSFTFAKPATTRFDLYLYVTNSTNWQVEGAFRYDEQWLIELEHPAAP